MRRLTRFAPQAFLLFGLLLLVCFALALYLRPTPRLTPASGVNSSGESFGVASEDFMPDLIAAQGINGRDGYIKKTDLEKIYELTTPSTPEEATNLSSDDTTIPLYDSDGITVLDSYPIVGSSSQEGE